MFNCYNEKVTGLSVSGYAAGDMQGWADGTGSATKYTPSGVAVERVKDIGSSAAFAIGDNAVVVPWDSFRGDVTVTIPDPKHSDVSLDDDLVLYITKNDAILLTTRGFVNATFPVALTVTRGDPVDAVLRDGPQREDLEALLPEVRHWLSEESINYVDVGPKTRGGRRTGELAVVVGVVRKKPLPDLGPNDFPIPPLVELHLQRPDGGVVAVDVPTDVVQVGEIGDLVLDQRIRPVPGGYQIYASKSLLDESTGTAAANIVYGGRFRMLTCNHVISGNGNVGGTVYQPTYALWGNSITTVDGFVPVTSYDNANQPNPVYNIEDLAWANIDATVGATNITNIGQPTGFRAPVVGEAVRWIGKSTGVVQNTTIAGTNGQLRKLGGDGKYSWWQNVITFAGGVGAEGDSGAAIVATNDMRIVGLIFAGNAAAGTVYGCSIRG